MENNKKGKRGIVDTSVVLSFVVAIFAVFSIAMAGLSMNQKSGISYAAPDSLANDFTFNVSNDRVTSTPDGQNYFSSPIYLANNDAENPVFCVEHNVNPDNGATYTGGDAIVDYGLLYILNNSLANGVSIVKPNNQNIVGTTDAKRAESAKYTNAWITQVAIWMYLYETDPTATQSTSSNYISPEDINIIKNSGLLNRVNESLNINDDVYVGNGIYNDYVKPLVDAAKTATDVAVLTVSKASDEIKQDENKKFYFSDKITVVGNPSDALQNYSVTLTGIEGAKAVGEDGVELGAAVPAGTKFYVRIPAEKVTKEVQKVVVSVNAKFTTLEGKYYTSATANKQKVVSVKASSKEIIKGTEVEFVGTDDTGMNTAQTIYFIGLIVLLCGVGIVYANAKPVQVKQ